MTVLLRVHNDVAGLRGCVSSDRLLSWNRLTAGVVATRSPHAADERCDGSAGAGDVRWSVGVSRNTGRVLGRTIGANVKAALVLC